MFYMYMVCITQVSLLVYYIYRLDLAKQVCLMQIIFG